MKDENKWNRITGPLEGKLVGRQRCLEVGFLKSCLEIRAMEENQVPIFGRFLLLVTTWNLISCFLISTTDSSRAICCSRYVGDLQEVLIYSGMFYLENIEIATSFRNTRAK